MTTVDTLRLTAEEADKLLRAKEISGAELFAAYLEAIGERDPELHAYLHVCDAGDGLPVAVKDVIGTRGIPTTAGSKILEAVSKVSELDLSDVPPTAHPLQIANAWAEDVPRPCLTHEETFANAPDVEDDHFRTPPA